MTILDVFVIMVGVGAFCGFLSQVTRDKPPIPLLWGLLGVWLAVGVWLVVMGTRRRSCLLQFFGGFFLFGLCVICLLPAWSRADVTTYKTVCRYNLRNIALALQNYHDVYDSFPPAYIADANGKPMHSWRVLILPFLENRNLYDQYRFDEPWNGPNNSRLASEMPEYYQCRASRNGQLGPPPTRYVAVVGPGTVWPDAKSTRFADIADGFGNTILIVETSNAPVHWMEPRDLDLRTMNLSINPKAGKAISSKHPSGGAHAAMVDASVVFLSEKKCTPNTLRALLTISGGEKVVAPNGRLKTSGK